MPKRKREDANGSRICKGEEILLGNLKRLGQLEPDAGVQELLTWGKTQGLSKRQDVRHLSKEIRRGKIDLKQFVEVQTREADGAAKLATGRGDYNAKELSGTLVPTERALLAHLQHTGQLGSDAGIQDLLQWGESLGISGGKNLRRMGKNIKLGDRFDAQQLATTTASDQQATDLANMAPSERVLLFYLQHTGQLSPSAGLQNLLEWGKLKYHSTRDSLQSLGEAVGGGGAAQKASALPKARTQTVAPSGHKLEPKKTIQPRQDHQRNECAVTGAGSMNWAIMAAIMVPSDLAILTHLQLIGQLPLDADLQSLLQLGRECGFTHNALREAGNDIRLGEPSASQEAYRERLEYLARRGFESMRSVLGGETPGVDGQRTVAIEAINHFDLDAEEPTQRFWRQTSTRDENLGYYRYPSIFARSRLDDADLNPMDTFAEPMGPPKPVSPMEMQTTREPNPDESLTESLDLSNAYTVGDRAALGVAVDTDTPDAPVAHIARRMCPGSLQISSYPEARMVPGSKIIEKCDNGNFTVNLLHDFNAMQTKRATCTVECKQSDLQALFGEPGGDSGKIGAESMASLDHGLDLENEVTQGDLVFVDYEDDLDLSGRLQIDNGTLLDEMDIDGV